MKKQSPPRPLVGLPPAPLAVGEQVVLHKGHTVWEVVDLDEYGNIGLVSRPGGVHRELTEQAIRDGRLLRCNGSVITIAENHR
jgi:hypothetical protein